jgi:hypothetical protein
MTAAHAPRARVTDPPPAVWLALTAALLVSVSVLLQVARDRAFPRDAAAESVLYVRSGPVVQRVALSYDALLADVYWIRALQHYGGTRRSPEAHKRYELLEPLLALTVSLDPWFRIAYRFGAIFLAEPWPGGPGRPDQAIALLRRGLETRPQEWRYMQDIGFVHYWWRHDYREAAAWFLRGAEQPNAPEWLRPLAATTLATGGDRQASRQLWMSLQQSESDWVRRSADRRLRQLDALDAVDRLRALVQSFARRDGTWPRTWETLVRAGYLSAMPRDPEGVPFELGDGGRVAVAPTSPLQPLPQEPPVGAQ